MQEIKKINLSLDWKTVELKSIADVTMGQSPKSEFYNDNFEGMPFLQGNKTFGDKYPSFELYTTSIKKVAKKSSVLMSVRAPVGDLNIAKEDICIGRGVCGLQMKKGNNEFLYYLLKANISHLINKESGTVFGSINKNDIETFEVTLPEDSEDQMKILTILKNIDKKIEVCRNLNKNLEESIKNIFKHYFIDFIPFKDKGYPEGWLSLNLGDVVSDANTGADAIKKAPIVDYDTGIKCVRVGDMTNSRRIDEWGFANVNEENFDKYQLKKEDIIVTRTATLGLNYFITEDLDAVYNNGLIRIKINKNKALPLFIYYYLNTSDYNHYIDCIEGESSTRPNMKINYLLKYPIICPPLKIQKEFIDLIDSLFWMKENIFYQIVELTRLRDTLLPKLMSGEIDVSKINCDLKIIIRKIYIKSSKLFLWRYLSENQNYIKNTKSNETLLKSRTIHKINKFFAKFNARYRYYRQQ